ncbi:MAG: hypothetical protein AB7V26_10015 [Lysobacterales bacterium]
MDNAQADAIAQAVLAPEFQERVRRKRAQAAAQWAVGQRRARFVVLGYLLGAALGHFWFGQMTYMGIAGALAGRLTEALRERFRKNNPAP